MHDVNYFPILREKSGEINAVGHLSPVTRSRMRPLFDFRDYDAVVRAVIGLLVNEKMTISDIVAERIGVPHRVVKHTFAKLENLGHLHLSRTLGSVSQILTLSPSLRRMLAH